MPIRVWVEHGMYGCATGCCGHFVRIEGRTPTALNVTDVFAFEHPWGRNEEERMAWAREHVAEVMRERGITEYEFVEANCELSDS